MLVFCFVRVRRRLRFLSSNSLRIEPFAFPSILNLGRRKAERRRVQGDEYESGHVQASTSIGKAPLDVGNSITEEVGPDERPSRLLGSQPLHRQTTRSSSVSTERQQSLRERAESMRGGISALEEILLNENVPEEQRRAAQAELQQVRSAMAMLSWMEQSDWARGLVDEPPPAYNALLGR
jgi:hypothetical protein